MTKINIAQAIKKPLYMVACVVCMGIVSPLFALTGDGGYASPELASDYIQDLSNFSSGLVNPALLYRVNQMHLNFGLYRWGTDAALGYQQASFLFPLYMNQTLGVTYVGNSAQIQKRSTASGVDQGTANFSDTWLVGSYSLRLLPWLMLGTNLKVVIQNDFGSKLAMGYGLDFGGYYNPIDHYRFGDIGLSVNLQDIVPATLTWKSGEKSNIPTRARAGVRYSAFNDRLIWDGEILFDDVIGELTNAKKNYDSTGKVQKPARFSSHGRVEFIPQIWFKLGWANNNIPYFGINFNLMYPLPEMVNYINNDFNFGYSFIENDRGFTMMYKLSAELGPTREQREARRMYSKLIIGPMNAYNEAMRLYVAGKYWEAAFAFGKVLALYPNFNLNDKAAFYMGNCYRFLQMNTIARAVYKDALDEYPTSETRAKYIYGLQSLDYREGKYEEALKNHAFISNLYAESDIKPDADYLAGQIHFARKNYNVAEQLFKKIEPGSPTYIYTQYTLSIINIEQNRIPMVIENLRAIVSDSTKDQSELLLRDAANVKLGHLYFERGEEGDLRKAVEAYKRVPEGSSYGDEALLATAWAWIKVGQPAYAMQTADRLMTAHSESPLVPEAYLVKGYSLMLQNNYVEAVGMLEKCLELAKADFVTPEKLAIKRDQFKQTEAGFAPTAEEIRKNALRKPTDKIIEERAGLEAKFGNFKKESDGYFSYILKAESDQRFLKRKESLVGDANYALAKANNLIRAKGQQKELENVQKKGEKIDQKIEDLQKQLEDLNKGK